MEEPLVSVIIPTYNAEKFVIDSIESVLNQDYKNLEIIISDDCSTDNTKQVILDFLKGKNLNFIKLFFNTKNLGVTKNGNQCLMACTGKYIAFLAGDDLMLPTKITTQINYLESHPQCVISYHNIEVFESDTNKTLYFYNSFFRNRARSGKVKDLIKYGCFCGGCSMMIRKENIPSDGYDEEFTIGSDWLLWISTLLEGGEIHYINKVLSKYRRHSNNITNRNSPQSKNSFYQALCISNKIIVNHPFYTKEALNSYGIHLRSLRHHYNGIYYKKFLLQSLRFNFSYITLILLIASIITVGRVKI